MSQPPSRTNNIPGACMSVLHSSCVAVIVPHSSGVSIIVLRSPGVVITVPRSSSVVITKGITYYLLRTHEYSNFFR